MTEFQNCYVIQFKIENFSMCAQRKGEMVESPYFKDSSENKEWSIKLYPRGFNNEDFISIELCYHLDVRASFSFEVSIIDCCGSPRFARKFDTAFKGPGSCPRIPKFVKRCDLFNKKALMLPNDSLTIRCTIRRPYRMHTISRSIKFEKLSFSWPIKNLSAMKQNGVNLTYPFKVNFDKAPEFDLEFCYEEKRTGQAEVGVKINKTSFNRKICHELFGRDPCDGNSFFNDITVVLSFEIRIMQDNGNVVGVIRDAHTFLASTEDESFIPKGVNVVERLPNDSLTLIADIQFSDGQAKTVNTFTESEYRQPRQKTSHGAVLDTMCEKLYADMKYCDVSLKVGDEVLKAHRAVLSAQSPVFRAMFDSDATDQKNGVLIDMVDFDAATVKLFLELVYTGRVDVDLPCEDLLKLYEAGHKYQVLALEIVSSLLVCGIESRNVWKVWSHAVKYNDRVFEAAKSFILEHTSESLNTLVAINSDTPISFTSGETSNTGRERSRGSRTQKRKRYSR